MQNNILQSLTEAAASALSDAFGCPVYQDEVAQGFEQPSIFIKFAQPARKKRTGQRYFQQVPFELLCFPGEKGSNRELALWADRLYDVLELLPLPEGPPWDGGTLRGGGMSHQVTDGVLHFFVSYRFYLWRDREEIYMEKVETDFTAI